MVGWLMLLQWMERVCVLLCSFPSTSKQQLRWHWKGEDRALGELWSSLQPRRGKFNSGKWFCTNCFTCFGKDHDDASLSIFRLQSRPFEFSFFSSCPGSFIPTLVVVGVSATLEILTQRVNFDPWHPRDIWYYDWSCPMTDYTTDPMTNPRIKNKTMTFIMDKKWFAHFNFRAVSWCNSWLKPDQLFQLLICVSESWNFILVILVL